MCLNPITLRNPAVKSRLLSKREFSSVVVPCGHCPECLARSKNDWAFRVAYDVSKSYGAYFVTLTYQDKYLPENGVSKSDAKFFLKKLSASCDCSYYLCAEYGSLNARPHYHLIVWTKDKDAFERLPELCVSCWTKTSGFRGNSDNVESIGIVDVLPCNSARIGYCCKYSMKQFGVEYGEFNKPFRLVSKSIGADFADSYSEQIRRANQWFIDNNGYRIPLPRYLVDKIYSKYDKEIHALDYLNDCWDYFERVADEYGAKRAFKFIHFCDKSHSDEVVKLNHLRHYVNT